VALTVDRTEINRALAKAIAYKQCGKDDDARQWARKLVDLLECAEILAPEETSR
jgi:Flp pilus assembly protein TadD